MIKDLQNKNFFIIKIIFLKIITKSNGRKYHKATLSGAMLLKNTLHTTNLPGNDHYHAMDRDDFIFTSKNLICY